MLHAQTAICLGVVALMVTAAAFAGDGAVRLTVRGEVMTCDDADVSNIGGASVAYNSVDDEWRVFWFDSRIQGQNDVYSQRIDADGTLIGDDIEIITGSPSQTETACAYSPVSNEYLVTWKNQSGSPGSPGFNHAFGGMVSAEGGLINGAQDLSNGGLEPTIAYNSVDDAFLLEARNFAGGGTPGIRGQRIDTDGDPIGGGLTIATAGAPAPAGQVAHNVDDNQYLATWRDQVDSDLKGRIINADGTFATSAFQISETFPSSGIAANVVYDPTNDRYLVVYATFSGGPLLAQFVAADGSLSGGEITIVDTSNTLFPWVDRQPLSGHFVVSWWNATTGMLHAVALNEDGAVVTETLDLPVQGSPSAPRVVASSADYTLLIVWVDRDFDAQKWDVLAQVVAITCIADLDGSGAIDVADLLVLLADWGATVSPADINADGVVDVQDLLALLEAWGPCPA
jgi:hypothetical protein